MNNQRDYTRVGLLIMLLWVAAFVGWVLNIVEIIRIVNDPIAGIFILRCVGIFIAPLGAALGYV